MRILRRATIEERGRSYDLCVVHTGIFLIAQACEDRRTTLEIRILDSTRRDGGVPEVFAGPEEAVAETLLGALRGLLAGRVPAPELPTV